MTTPVISLTARQDEVLRELLRDGAPDRLLGRRLGINDETVATHLRKIYTAACDAGVPVHSRSELIAAMYHERLAVHIRWGAKRT